MKKLLAIVVLLAVGLGMNSCKKYEEGPLLSLRSKTARIANDWVIDKVMSNGVDVSSIYPEDYVLSLLDDNTFKIESNGVSINGTWDFTEDKEGIKLTQSSTGTEWIYNLIMVKNKELTFEQTLQTEVFTFYLVEKPE